LLLGDYSEGLALYESRLDIMRGNPSVPAATRQILQDPRRWHGDDLAGRRVLVWAEQGFGDSLMMLRYLPMVAARGAREIIVLCEPALARIAASIIGVNARVSVMQTVPVAAFDVHCPIMSLPFVFDTTLDSIPNRVPYIDVPEGLRTPWQERLVPLALPRVGLVWAGSSNLEEDSRRSVALATFEPIIRSSVSLVSLQKGVGAEQLDHWAGRLIDWMPLCDDFMDTAALIAGLDLVISVDTAVAHLAGALGKPVWLLNRSGSEWRWGLESEHCAWYPTIRIFRQEEATSWAYIVAKMADELEKSNGPEMITAIRE